MDAVLKANVGVPILKTTIGVTRLIGFDRPGKGLDSAI
jgi:hypothetical protein